MVAVIHVMMTAVDMTRIDYKLACLGMNCYGRTLGIVLR